jgi:hypothetical protein
LFYFQTLKKSSSSSRGEGDETSDKSVSFFQAKEVVQKERIQATRLVVRPTVTLLAKRVMQWVLVLLLFEQEPEQDQ